MVTRVTTVFHKLFRLFQLFQSRTCNTSPRRDNSQRGTAKCEYVLLASLLSTALIASTNPLSAAIDAEFSQFTNALTAARPTTDYHPINVPGGNRMTTKELIKNGLLNEDGSPRIDGTIPPNSELYAQNDLGGGSTGTTPTDGGATTGNALNAGHPTSDEGSTPPPPNGSGDGAAGSSAPGSTGDANGDAGGSTARPRR